MIRAQVAEVLGELAAVVEAAPTTAPAALAFRTKGKIHQGACYKCKKRNDDALDNLAIDELARSAPAAAIAVASKFGSPEDVETIYRNAHAHAAKSCDHCHRPMACKVDLQLQTTARALVLSCGWRGAASLVLGVDAA